VPIRDEYGSVKKLQFHAHNRLSFLRGRNLYCFKDSASRFFLQSVNKWSRRAKGEL